MATEEQWRATYEAKVEDFARETRRTSVLSAVVRRLVETVSVEFAASGYSQKRCLRFWNDGFPPDEREALLTALRGSHLDDTATWIEQGPLGFFDQAGGLLIGGGGGVDADRVRLTWGCVRRLPFAGSPFPEHFD